MSDDLDLLKMGTHAATGIGGGGIVAAFMRWMQSRDAQESREELIGLRGDVKRLIEDVGEHKKVFEDVVESKLLVKAMHKRQDEFEKRLERLESKRR